MRATVALMLSEKGVPVWVIAAVIKALEDKESALYTEIVLMRWVAALSLFLNIGVWAVYV